MPPDSSSLDKIKSSDPNISEHSTKIIASPISDKFKTKLRVEKCVVTKPNKKPDPKFQTLAFNLDQICGYDVRASSFFKIEQPLLRMEYLKIQTQVVHER
ncbi:hypothetical protein RF11_14924 [Thelohanellus kitauei]|uniref:Uncharacterized protein n=1 Tax=Thelohanellus kitauei TaxID=669202 RepID=A0A0C2N038_THEKT|nr:hypothetical protein RF11_11032 [Thelohanellus kitauei]KII69730.1 hypothetical protein RF11_14924 [Thelohanellus kitauei]